jgi:hypothetical protein
MRYQIHHHLPLFVLWLFTVTSALPSRSPKRGLVYVSTPHSTIDDTIWTQPNSDLTWYYNYSPYPNSAYPHLEFAPMLFSIPTDDSFTTQIATLLDSAEANITHILAFNEPDGPTSQGGTSLSPSAAAKSYMTTLASLLTSHPKANLQLGWPAVTGSPRGLIWLADFNTSCHRLASSGCPASFLPIHWYGDFAGLASYVGQIHDLYPKLPLWVTEFADPNADIGDSQGFFNQSVAFLDRLDYVDRYAYFGAFRSQDSNIGGEGVMLDKGGALTDVGEWYLGLNGTGRDPDSGVARLGFGGGRWWSQVCASMVLTWALWYV